MTTVVKRGAQQVREEAQKPIEKVPLEMMYPKQWISSGCVMYNLCLSGHWDKGYVVGRAVDVVGDYSTGKTLLASEAVNVVWYEEHLKKEKNVRIRYNDTERKFNKELAARTGMPIDEIEWVSSDTIEEIYEDVLRTTKESAGKNDIVLYVCDSIDNVGSGRRQKRTAQKGVGSQDYNVASAVVLTQLFKDIALDDANCLLFLISQVRYNLSAGFGSKKYTMSGGKALTHNCTHISWLRQIETLRHENGMTQGIRVQVEVDKNHVGPEGRRAEFSILNGIGIDDIGSTVLWAATHDVIEKAGSWYAFEGERAQGAEKMATLFDQNRDAYHALCLAVQKRWNEMEEEARIERKPKWGR